jgi:hypothetical protein
MNRLVVPKFHENKESEVKASIERVKIFNGSKVNKLVQHSDHESISFLTFELVER